MIMDNRFKILILNLIGLTIAILPTFLAVISYFPIWKERGTATMISAFSLCLVLVAFLPLMRFMKAHLKSPSATTVWFITFIMFCFLSRIADDMTIISFVGFISNLTASFFFSLARMRKENPDEE